ncbi:MAG: LacI family DNA-binding transcriptional regulator [Frankiales bacterium]|nr:LacI family DNA-binding transcriptional regulator [Frankiales bacterium]
MQQTPGVQRRDAASGRPNLEQVAALAGVSRATVSRVVNGLPSVDAELRARVEAAVTQLGYTPNHAARSLVTRRTDTVALVVAEPDHRVFGDPFFSGIVRGINQECQAAGLHMLLLMAQSTSDRGRVDRYLATAPIDGVLLISEHAQDDPWPRSFRRRGVPFVVGGRPVVPDEEIRYVDNDNVAGATLAVRHLLASGRSVVGTVTGPQDMSAGIDRLAGYRAGLGRRFRASRVEHGDFTTAGGEAATRRLLDRVPDLDAVFAASDLMALGALRALAAAGRRVPDDVAVVGFDDIDAAAVSTPALTTVRQETVLQGRAMVRMLVAHERPELLLDPVPGLEDVDLLGGAVVLPVGLVVRESA